MKAIFDIGKTNKKFFIFDNQNRELFKQYISFNEIKDEDGFPAENIHLLSQWVINTFNEHFLSSKWDIRSVNFSTYGASLVHIDDKGNVLTPLYNYLKPFPRDILNQFIKKYQGIEPAVGTPIMGMLNSGLQLYWLKYTKPELFKKINTTMHLPQYLSYLFTGIATNDFTSIGCHSALWNYDTKNYHTWVYDENIASKLAPVVSTYTSINCNYLKRSLQVGVGIHDSSSALLPYLYKDEKEPFLLLSTGTWSVILNPFNVEKLSAEDIQLECLNYMRVDGQRIKATRFFMGDAYKTQTEIMSKHFHKNIGYHRGMKFNVDIFKRLINSNINYYHFENIARTQPTETNLTFFNSYEDAYHQLMIELLFQQVKMIKMAIGTTQIKKIYVNGGFVSNDIFINILKHLLKDFSIHVSPMPLGSSIGAALVLNK